MKKQIRQFLKYGAWLMVLAVVICVNSTLEITAQKKSKGAQTTKTYWYMDFTITVKGNGKKTNPKDHREPTISWSIDRTYSGSMKLNSSLAVPMMGVKEVNGKEISSQEILNAIKTKRFTRYSTPQNVGLPIRVKINDVLNVITKEKDRAIRGSFQTTTVATIWEVDKTFDGISSNVWLNTDSKSLTYNVSIPILFIYSKMNMRTQTTIDRSNFGYGDKPTHEETPVTETEVRFSIANLPTVEGLIKESYIIEHKPDKPFPPNFLTTWEYDSGDRTPDKPLIDNVPDSKTDVKVRVRYRFSKTPLY